MKREYLHISEDKIEDYTKKNGSWVIDGEIYNFIDTFLIKGDGECHAVIVQRESDKKYFQFEWCYDGGNYYYEYQWDEVIPKVITKTTYVWE